MISVEEWKRLPLPEDYKHPVLLDIITNTSELEDHRESICYFEEPKVKNLRDIQESNTLSDFGLDLLRFIILT